MSDPGRPPAVWITGIGLVAPSAPEGAGPEAAWRSLRDGHARPSPLEPRDPAHGPRHHGFPAPFRKRFDAGFDPLPRIVEAAAIAAAHDAGLGPRASAHDPDRAAVLFGLSKGRMLRQEAVFERWRANPADDADLAYYWPRLGANEGARRIARLLRTRGPCLAPVAACATGLIAAIQGADLIRHGHADVAFVGAADASLTPFLLGAFRRLKVLAPVDVGDDPARAVRPWNRDRRGFLVGEGGAVLVLERAEHACARGALPYAEFAGGAMGSDAHHLTDQDPNPSGLAHLIALALRNANLAPADIDHVNVHGTATRSNDPLECRAIRRAFGPHADGLSCSANKAQVGHLLGAAGAVELAFTALAIRDQFAPPTANLTDPDPACDLDGTPLVGKPREIRAALKLSLGFGGHLACAVLRRPDGARREGPRDV
jgi:3-oxoacyl-[acyl-carrier-protein] synthase II